MSNIYLCSFASFNLAPSAYRFYRQALDMGIFEDIFIYNECNLASDFKVHFRDKIYNLDSKNTINFATNLDSKNATDFKNIIDSKNNLDSKTSQITGGGVTHSKNPKNIESSTFKIDTSPSKHLPLSKNYTFSRGFGYWAWKPQIILQSLDKIQENDILLYVDIGSSFVPAGKESLLKKLEILQNEPLANFVSHWTKERVWCKGDVFAYFDVLDNPKYIDGGTAKGGTIFMKKCEKTIAFMREWLEIFWQFFELVDDSPSKIPNYPEFIENRHDQTILSMLLKKHNIYTFEDYHRHDHSNIEFGIIDTRDKVGLDLPRLNNQQKVTKILRFLGKILPNQKLRHDFRSLSGHIHRI